MVSVLILPNMLQDLHVRLVTSRGSLRLAGGPPDSPGPLLSVGTGLPAEVGGSVGVGGGLTTVPGTGTRSWLQRPQFGGLDGHTASGNLPPSGQSLGDTHHGVCTWVALWFYAWCPCVLLSTRRPPVS